MRKAYYVNMEFLIYKRLAVLTIARGGGKVIDKQVLNYTDLLSAMVATFVVTLEAVPLPNVDNNDC